MRTHTHTHIYEGGREIEEYGVRLHTWTDGVKEREGGERRREGGQREGGESGRQER